VLIIWIRREIRVLITVLVSFIYGSPNLIDLELSLDSMKFVANRWVTDVLCKAMAR
jgi:hypothetical protein